MRYWRNARLHVMCDTCFRDFDAEAEEFTFRGDGPPADFCSADCMHDYQPSEHPTEARLQL